MNENLKKLLEQATIYAFDSRFVPGDNPRPVADVIQEKFAELIVRECADIANNHFESKEPGYPGDKVEEHFGVEE